ncbi:MAG TPA: TM2 domain-containing protein [Firmicutes bacterium]|nr:TM2 domain-containing protein [Bacillota bacterium]
MPKRICPYCGTELEDTAQYCSHCGAPAPAANPQTPPQYQQSQTPPGPYSSYPYSSYGQNTYGQPNYQPPYSSYPGYSGYPGYQTPYPPSMPVVPPGYQPRNRIAAGILAIVIGCLGIHNFYLGFTSRGVVQLLLTVLSCGVLALVSQIWAIVEGVQILTGRIVCDARGVPLVN